MMYFEPFPQDLEIQETPDSLVINYRGRQSVGQALILLIFTVFVYILMPVNIVPNLTRTNQSDFDLTVFTLICLGSFLFLFIYGAYITLSLSLDLMLHLEKITITTEKLRIEKSGFGSIHISREFRIKKSAYLHPMIQPVFPPFTWQFMISLSPSKLIARMSQSGSFRSYFLASPMRWFCRGSSIEDQAFIFERIRKKFPHINILMYDDPLVKPG